MPSDNVIYSIRFCYGSPGGPHQSSVFGAVTCAHPSAIDAFTPTKINRTKGFWSKWAVWCSPTAVGGKAPLDRFI